METITYKRCTIKLVQDEDPESPREWNNVGEILYTSSRYNLGDRRTTSEEIREITQRKDVVYLPVYAYIHSGIALRTGPFGCPWDSGQCGIIWCTKEKAVKEWGKKRFTKAVRKKAEQCLEGEIKTLDSYFRGDIVGFIAENPDGEEIDSCWGFYPDDSRGYSKRWEYPIEEAKASIDHWREKRTKERREERRITRSKREQHMALA